MESSNKILDGKYVVDMKMESARGILSVKMRGYLKYDVLLYEKRCVYITKIC